MSEASSSLKQRLVGAFVMVSLAIIFLPMIFDEPHHLPNVPPHLELPAQPEVSKVTINKPVKPQFESVQVDPSDQRVKKVSEVVPVVAEPGDAEPEAGEDIANTVADVSVPTQNSKEASSGSKQSKVDSRKLEAPEVSHLPVFKNVWMLQLGTFSSEQNANALRDQMRKDGFDAHTKKVTVGTANVVRVFTGPFVNRSEAERVKKKVDQRYKVDSLIVFLDA